MITLGCVHADAHQAASEEPSLWRRRTAILIATIGATSTSQSRPKSSSPAKTHCGISVAAQQLGLLLVGPMRRCLTSHRRRCRLTGGDGTQEGNTIPDSPPLPKNLCISLVNPLHPVPRIISPTRSTTNAARRPVEKTPPALVPSRFGSEIHSFNPVVACLPVDPPWSLAIESRLRSAHGYFGRRRKPRYTCWICRQPSAIG